MVSGVGIFFLFKQKTAYEMRISDWSSDVCSSDLISSDAVYPMKDGLVSEATPAEPTDLYAAMHITRELMAKATVKAPLAVLRPTLIYGAEDTHNSYGPNRLRRMARKDARRTLFGAGEETRDHISVDDVYRLILLTLRHRSEGVVNLATGHSISYMELARKIADLFDTPVDLVTTPRRNPVTHRHFAEIGRAS